MLPNNPYGITHGINYKLTPPVPSSNYLSQQIVDWAAATGIGWFRVQVSAELIWYNQSDPPSNWFWGPLDDAVSKLQTVGFWISYPLRFDNPGSTTYWANNVQATSGAEVWYMPNPTYMAQYAAAVAARYNGQQDCISNGINYGKLTIHSFEIGNEEFNIHFSSPAHPPTIFGTYNSPYSLYDAFSPIGVDSALHPAPQPTRDPHWVVPCLQACYNPIKTANPNATVVTNALWWTQPNNHQQFTNGLYNDPTYGSAKGYFDRINLHYYSNKIDPLQGSSSCATIAAAIQQIDDAMNVVGDTSKLWITEFGWQVDTLTWASTSISPGTVTVTPASMNSIATGASITVDSGSNAETVTVSAKTFSTFTATFTKSHTGTYQITISQDCSANTQVTNYTTLLDASRQAPHLRVERVFFYTLDDKHTSTDASSLIQWGWNQNPVTGYVNLPAYSTMTSYVQNYPVWTVPTSPEFVTDTFIGVTGKATFTGVVGDDTYSGSTGKASCTSADGTATFGGIG